MPQAKPFKIEKPKSFRYQDDTAAYLKKLLAQKPRPTVLGVLREQGHWYDLNIEGKRCTLVQTSTKEVLATGVIASVEIHRFKDIPPSFFLKLPGTNLTPDERFQLMRKRSKSKKKFTPDIGMACVTVLLDPVK